MAGAVTTRWRSRRPAGSREARIHIRVVGGPLDGRLVSMKPPLPRELERDGIRYTLDRMDSGYVAIAAQEQSDHIPVLAWRAWRLKEGEAGEAEILTSGGGEEWSVEGPIVARCENAEKLALAGEEGHGPAPVLDCSCGVYCTKTMRHLQGAGFPNPEVYGLLAAWGRIDEHELGYRVQRAYPVALIVNSLAISGIWTDDAEAALIRRRVDELARRYRVPVAAAVPERAVEMVVRLVLAKKTYPWVEEALPVDGRIALMKLKNAQGRK